MKKLSFTLPILLPLLNVRDRTHRVVRRKQQIELAWMVSAALKTRPAQPFPRALVTIERCSTGTPDIDNLYGSAKGLMDVLCPASRVHPFGLGIITDDNPSVCDLRMRATRVSRRSDHKTVVTVEAIP